MKNHYLSWFKKTPFLFFLPLFILILLPSMPRLQTIFSPLSSPQTTTADEPSDEWKQKYTSEPKFDFANYPKVATGQNKFPKTEW
jgi:hypothetical protein